MSAEVIQSKYEELETIACRFGQQAQATRELQRRVRRGAGALRNGGWEGRGSAAFTGEMEQKIFPAMQRLMEALAEAQATTLQVKAIIQKAEEEAASVFREPGAQQKKGSWWDRWGEWVHGGLDVLGFVPVVGELADGANALIYLAEGRHLEAGISAAAMIPFLGDLGKAGKWGAKAGKELLEEGAERVAKEAAERAVRDIAAREAAQQLGKLGDDVASPTARQLVDDVARNSTHGSGNRVVLGEYIDDTAGYIGEARKNGGIYYQTADGVYDGMKANKNAPWAVNEQFLRNQLEARVERIDFVSGDIYETMAKYPDKFRTREIEFLLDKAGDAGYVQVGNSWIRKDVLERTPVLDRVIIKTTLKAGKLDADDGDNE